MRRTAMKRSAPPKRSPSEGGDEAYLAFVRALPCCAPTVAPCLSPAPQHPHHKTGAGMAMKARDDETMPLCWVHHRDFHLGQGPFLYWTRDNRDMWQEEMVDRVRRAHALMLSASEVGDERSPTSER